MIMTRELNSLLFLVTGLFKSLYKFWHYYILLITYPTLSEDLSRKVMKYREEGGLRVYITLENVS